MSYKQLTCSFCRAPLVHTFVDLGMAPMVSSYLKEEELQKAEPFFPLHAYVCGKCFLVQLPEAQTPEKLFGDYPYFSSVSESWLRHSENYVEYMVDRFKFSEKHQVIEIASNDGYLLQFFKRKNIPVQGVEPARNVARVAEEIGIPTISKFFGIQTARELVAVDKKADLLLGNNVLAHVPDINDFVAGMKLLLKVGGVITLEFPHLLRTMQGNQFDQVFHEHFSYLSLIVVENIFAQHGLAIFDVQDLPTHGGSIRVFGRHADDNTKPRLDSVDQMIIEEHNYGLDRISTYASFSQQARDAKFNLLSLLINVKRSGQSIVGYGAPGKGCVMLNYCGIRSDILDYLVDLSPAKQRLYMPGVHLPIYHPDKIRETEPDYVLILPWNLSKEITKQLSFISAWGGKFVVPIPDLRVVDAL